MSEEMRKDEHDVGGRRAWLIRAIGAAVALGAVGASISCAKKEEPSTDGSSGTADTTGGTAGTTGGTDAGATGATPGRLWYVDDLDFEGDTLVIKNHALADSMERVKFNPGHSLYIKRISRTHPGQKVNIIC